MAFDGIITRSVVSELNKTIIEGKVNKIYQPSKNEILLGLYAEKKNYCLLINIESSNCRMHLTTKAKANPLQAPNFCMVLRKHLIGYRIKNIENDGLERIIRIELEGYDEFNDKNTKTLLIELMGKHSNVILLNQKGFIIDSMRHLDSFSGSYREILPAHEYCLPQSEKQDILLVKNFDEFYGQIKDKIKEEKKEDFYFTITSIYTGISKSFLEVLDEDKTQENISKEQMKNIFDKIKRITSEIGSNNLVCVEYENKKGKKDYTLVEKAKEDILQINFQIDDFHNQKESKELYKAYRNQILKIVLDILKKYQNRLVSMDKKLQECNKKEQYRIYGELITSNLYRIKEEKKASITLENYYDNNEEVVIPLDKRFSISQNAKRYFKKYNKLKNAEEIVTKQKEDTQKELVYIESIVYELENAKTVEEIAQIDKEIAENLLENIKYVNGKKKQKSNQKKKEEKNKIQEYEIDGFTVLIGKNNKQNDEITTKLARRYDIWLHTKDIHGSHVILKVENEQEVPKEIIEQVAQIAAYHSKAKLSSNVPVDYCYIKDVKKPSGSKPGMVIYKNNKTIFVNPKSEEEMKTKNR